MLWNHCEWTNLENIIKCQYAGSKTKTKAKKHPGNLLRTHSTLRRLDLPYWSLMLLIISLCLSFCQLTVKRKSEWILHLLRSNVIYTNKKKRDISIDKENSSLLSFMKNRNRYTLWLLESPTSGNFSPSASWMQLLVRKKINTT